MRFLTIPGLNRRLVPIASVLAGLIALSGCGEHPSDEGIQQAMSKNMAIDQMIIEKRLQAVEAGLKIEAIQPSPIKGLAEVTLNNGQTIYTSEDGSYVLNGKMFQLSENGVIDLSAEKQRAIAYSALKKVDLKEMIVYPAQVKKTHITIFTDVDYPYCQKIHAEVKALTDSGIEVRYTAYPRHGIGSETAERMSSIWCASDRQTALDAALKQEPIERVICQSPVEAQFKIGQKLGVSGTPAVFFADGSMRAGYGSAAEIADAALKAQEQAR